MSGFMITLFRLSLAASILIAAVVLFRLLFNRAPKWIRGVLWAMVAARLLVPFFPESAFSVVPRAITADFREAAETSLFEGEKPTGHAETPTAPSDFSGQQTSAYISDTIGNGTADSVNAQTGTESTAIRNPDIYTVLFAVWMTGASAMTSYAVATRVRLRRRLRASVPVKCGVLASDYVDSPFVLGLFFPKIYVPSSITENELEYVLRHEKAHVTRRDDLRKFAGFIILCAYWFCPAVWLGYVLFCRDIEYACDELAMRGTDRSYRIAYSKTLVDFRIRNRAAAGPLGFGRIGVERRVKSVLNYKKPAVWAVVVSLVVCAVIGVCFLTSPKASADEPKSDLPASEATGEVWDETDLECIRAFVDGDLYKAAKLALVADEFRESWVEKARAVRDAAEFSASFGDGVSDGVFEVRGSEESPLPAGQYVFVRYYPTVRAIPVEEKDETGLPSGIDGDAYDFVSLFALNHREFSAALESGDPSPFYSIVCWRMVDAEERAAREDYHMTDAEFAAGLQALTGISAVDLTSLDGRRDETGYLYFSPRFLISEGSCEAHRIVGVRERENGYDVTFRSYADFLLLVPSDLYVISVSRSDGDYAWVLDDIRIIEKGEIPPAVIYSFGRYNLDSAWH